jgi:nucleotide-binding universal stress UspA family protein
MRVLLAIDSSTASQLVVSTAASRPWPSGTIFCVMRVVDMGRWEGLPVLVEDAKHEAQSLVTHTMNKLTQSGQEAFSEVQSGLPKKAIPEYASQWRADLVMVGSHGQSALTRFFLGSVAQAILRTAPCSVEIVRPSPLPSPASPGMKILLATDGTECSQKAVYSVANRPWPRNGQIGIISVAQLLTLETQTTTSLLCSPYPTSLVESVWEEARKRAQDAVADARKTLTAAGLNIWDGEATPVGDPRSFILDAAKAWGADLIVLGSHGRHGWDRLLIGSVAEAVALHAHCSVEVVRG